MSTAIGDYRILRELGVGGMGTVYLAETPAPLAGLPAGTPVAVKVILEHLVREADFVERFRREAAYGLSVVHPNVVRTLACESSDGPDGPLHFLVMEYVEGQTLADLLQELGQVPEALCRWIGQEIARGLGAIHDRGIVHRDLKPSNVMITPRNDVKVMDLGVARLQDELIRLSRTGRFFGSIPYAAPEAFGGDDALGPRSDLFSLGVLLYELATGQHPFRADDVHATMGRILTEVPRPCGEIVPQLSPFFEQVIHTLLARDPDERFAGAHEVARALEVAEQGSWWRRHARRAPGGAPTPARRARTPRATRLFGREEELARLRGWWNEARGGEGRVVLLTGEAGIGKSRLVEELAGAVEATGVEAVLLEGAWPPGGVATSPGALAAALREHLGEDDLEGRLAPLLGEMSPLVPAFAALLRGLPPPAGHPPLGRDALHGCFAAVLRALAETGPVLLALDGLHEAPEEGRALFATLAQQLADTRVLLVGTARPGLPPGWTTSLATLAHLRRLELGRLGAKDLARLLEDRFHSAELAARLGHAVALKSDGNPFFVFEIVRALEEGGSIAQANDGSWEATSEVVEVEVPDSVRDLINARVADLDREDRELLEVAACDGHLFDPLRVARASGMERLGALRRFAHVEKRHGLVHSAGRRMHFDHPQVQEALYDALMPVLREEIHLALARAIEDEETTEPPGARAQTLCHHYLAAGRVAEALPHLDAALDHLGAQHLHTEARRVMRGVLDAEGLVRGGERAGLLLRLASELDLAAARDEQAAALDEAETLATREGAHALVLEALRARGTLLFRLGRFEEAGERFAAMRDLAREVGDARAEGNALGGLGTVAWAQGRNEEARGLHEHHLALARRLGDRHGELKALGNLANALGALTRQDEALACLEEVVALARADAAAAPLEVTACLNLGVLLAERGRHAEAREAYERGIALARRLGDRAGAARLQNNLAALLRSRGLFDEAAEILRAQLRTAREVRDPVLAAGAEGNLGAIERARGALEEARQALEAWRAGAAAVGDRRHEAEALIDLGLVDWDLGRYDDAARRWEAAGALGRALGDRRLAGMAEANVGSVLAVRGDVDAARQRFEAYRDLAREVGDPTGEAAMRLELARLDRATGDEAAAAEGLEAAIDLAAHQGLVELELLARALQARTDPAAVPAARDAWQRARDRVPVPTRIEVAWHLAAATGEEAYREEARRLLDRLRAKAPLADRDRLVRRVALYREVAAAARG